MAKLKQNFLYASIAVGDSEVALLFRDERFQRVLKPGKYRVLHIGSNTEFQVFDTQDIFPNDELLNKLARENTQVAELFDEIITDAAEVANIYLDNQMLGVVPPGERLLMWKGVGDLRVERFNLDGSLEVDRQVLSKIKARGLNQANKLLTRETLKRQPLLTAQVPEKHVGILYQDGELKRKLQPGVYAFWQLNNDLRVSNYDLRSRTLEVSGQEILTKDRVSIRINLTANLKVVDPIMAAQQVDKLDEYLYKSMQLALREAVGTKTLDQLLEDKLYVNDTVKALVADEFTLVGVELARVGVKDIILPGEIRTILNKVVEAQKAAEANVIKRREETAATRSLYNTAKMMENNPTLLRLKELEALEKVSEKVDRISVYDGLDGLMKGTVQLS